MFFTLYLLNSASKKVLKFIPCKKFSKKVIDKNLTYFETFSVNKEQLHLFFFAKKAD